MVQHNSVYQPWCHICLVTRLVHSYFIKHLSDDHTLSSTLLMLNTFFNANVLKQGVIGLIEMLMKGITKGINLTSISIMQQLFHRDHFVYVPSQWEMLQCNTVSHWLGAYTKWSLFHRQSWIMNNILCWSTRKFHRRNIIHIGFN